MVNLANELNNLSIGSILNAWYEANCPARHYLGLSSIGHPCLRWLWYAHKGFDQTAIEGQTLRLFELGNIIESALKKDLRLAGFTIADEQKEVDFTFNNIKLIGHIDGIITSLLESNKPHLLEIKTANEKSFNELKKAGSYEKWQPKYKSQIHAYMLGLGLDRCLVIVYNKNTSEIYSERIKLDKNWIINRLETVFCAIGYHDPPERLCPRADWHEAKWCGFYGECF